MNPCIIQSGRQNAALAKKFCEEQGPGLEQLAKRLAQLFAEGGQVLTAGTGLLQLVAQLVAVQFSYRLDFNRPTLPAVCLGSDVALSSVMASAGDYELLFVRHYRALIGTKQVVLLFSDGSPSPALERLRDELLEQGQAVVLLSGSGRNDPLFCEALIFCFDFGTGSRARQIEMMQFAGHLLCELVEAELFHC